MLYEVFAIAITIFNLEGEPVHTQYIETPHPQTCYTAVEDYEAIGIEAQCVMMMKKLPKKVDN